jgi:hypothetical protein
VSSNGGRRSSRDVGIGERNTIRNETIHVRRSNAFISERYNGVEALVGGERDRTFGRSEPTAGEQIATARIVDKSVLSKSVTI